MPVSETRMDVVVVDRRIEADGIVSVALARPDGELLPPFQAGAHVDIYVKDAHGSEIIRQYSLCSPPAELSTYRLGVLLEPASRGGSAGVHRECQPGRPVQIGWPRNNFPLADNADASILLAGGIGITPMIAMGHALAARGQAFHLHYCGRSASRMAFLDLLSQPPFEDRVSLHIDDGPEAQRFDAASTLPSPDGRTHLYVCGPQGFMDHVLGAVRARGWDPAHIHVEYFGQAPAAGPAGQFQVQVGREGRILVVPPELSIADVLERAGVAVKLSCEQGVCGTCLTRILDGIPDHRDLYQSDAEKASNSQMTVCCSRALSPLLVLDI